jgi:hypothetical protein
MNSVSSAVSDTTPTPTRGLTNSDALHIATAFRKELQDPSGTEWEESIKSSATSISSTFSNFNGSSNKKKWSQTTFDRRSGSSVTSRASAASSGVGIGRLGGAALDKAVLEGRLVVGENGAVFYDLQDTSDMMEEDEDDFETAPHDEVAFGPLPESEEPVLKL